MPLALFQLLKYPRPVAAAQYPLSVAAYLQNSQPGVVGTMRLQNKFMFRCWYKQKYASVSRCYCMR